MSGGTIAAISAYIPALALSGSLSQSAAPSGGNVTSSTVTITKDVASSGNITFNSFSITGSVGTWCSQNGGGFSVLSDGDTLNFATGGTIALRGTGMAAGESWTFTLIDVTRGVSLGTYTIAAI